MTLALGLALWALSASPSPVAQDPNPAAPAAAATAPSEDAWPRVFKRDTGSLTVYPPTLQSWTGTTLSGTCAIALASADGSKQTFGTMAFSATTIVDKMSRTVELRGFEIRGVSLPENPAGQDALEQELESKSKTRVLRVSLDRLEAAVPSLAEAPAAPTAPLRHEPPRILVVDVPTVLVPVQGDPVWKPLQGTALVRIVNTPMLLVRDTAGAHSLRIADGWMTASSLSGPWQVNKAPSADLTAALKWAASQPQLNLLAPADPKDAQAASLANGAPAIVVATTPTEVVVTDGPPVWEPLGDSGLRHVTNTSGHVFELTETKAVYVLLSGRWFTAASTKGPWSFVAPGDLPTAFRGIPVDGAKENVLASVPGSPQAQEALIANSIPQMARVPRTQVMPKPEVAGDTPRWTTIEGTNVQVLQNSITPVFRTSEGALLAVLNGIWFTAATLEGPWQVATWVSPDIYRIPASSPWYYVTFVRVYQVADDHVLVGYTPGYFGSYTDGGVVVYGTGYWYRPYCDTVWVPAPWTYGCGASLCYSPWAGWSYGFGMGLAVGWNLGASTWRCGAYPCWGPYHANYGMHGAYAWGPGGWAATTGNVYSHWGDVSTMTRSSAGYNAWSGNAWATQTGVAYNSVTGARQAGQRGYVENAYTGNWAEGARGAGYNPTTGAYAAGRGVEAGTANGQEVAAGTATVGNVKTGNSARVAGVETENGTWGAVNTEQGGAVAHDGEVYGMHDGNAYHYDSNSGSWNRYSGNGKWNKVDDESTRRQLDSQAATRGSGDARVKQGERWQSGGEGFSGQRSTTNRSGNSWAGSAGNRSSSGSSRSSGGRSGGGGRR